MKLRKAISVVLALCMSIGIFSAYIPVHAADEIVIHILHTNDVHGRFYEVDNNNAGMIGIDKVAALKQSYENAILVDVGDAIHGLPIVNHDLGLSAIEMMIMAGYDVMVPGNHDFNWSSDLLWAYTELADEEDMFIISANIYDLEDDEEFLDAYAIIEVAGIKVGFFGLTTITTPVVTHPNNVATLEFLDYVSSAEAAIEDLLEEGADVIIMLAHVTRENELEEDILDILDALTIKPDLVIDGHDHLSTQMEHEGIIITGSGSYQSNLGVVTLTIDAEGNKSFEAALISKEDTAEVEPDAELHEFAEELKAYILEIFSEVVAESEITLSSARGDAETKGVRNSEQPLGNLVADAMRIYAEADTALTNGGGLRADIKEGEVTVGDINSVLPFGNVLVVKQATPKGLREALENGLSAAPAALGGFPQISGFSVSYNPEAEIGHKVVSLIIGDKVVDLDDDTTTFTLATNDFMAAGGDGYDALAAMPVLAEIEALDTVLEVYIVEYLDGVITEEDAKLDGRILEAIIAVEDPGLMKEAYAMVIDSLVVTFAGEEIEAPPVAPQIINDRTMLPFRYLVQTILHGEVDFDPETYTITATVGDHEVIMVVNEQEISVDGASFEYGQAPVIVDGSTLVPLRAFDTLVTKLDWVGETRTVLIYP